MDKIPVNIIISKNKNTLSPRCTLWYIPYCPVDIKNVDEWYDKISTFIDTHNVEYNILHIPNTIYDKTESDKNKKVNIYAKHLFLVGIGTSNDMNKLVSITNKIPDGYHIAYRLQSNAMIYNPYEQNEQNDTDDFIYNYVVKILLFVLLVMLCSIYILA